MVEATNEFIVQLLQRIQADIGDLKLDVREIRQRVGSLEVQMAGVSSRMDRRDDLMERMMRRLDLVEEEHAPSL